MIKFIRWFNNSRFLSWLLTPWTHKYNWKGYQRIRICEACHHITNKIHWSKADKEVKGKIVYDHKYLCDMCFYNFDYGEIE